MLREHSSEAILGGSGAFLHEAIRLSPRLSRYSIQQNEPVRPDLQGKGLPFFLAFGQAVFLDAPSIPLEPGWLHDPAQPIRRSRSQVVQRGAERFGHQFEQVQVVPAILNAPACHGLTSRSGL